MKIDIFYKDYVHTSRDRNNDRHRGCDNENEIRNRMESASWNEMIISDDGNNHNLKMKKIDYIRNQCLSHSTGGFGVRIPRPLLRIHQGSREEGGNE